MIGPALEKICFNCPSYTTRLRRPEDPQGKGAAYCRLLKAWFENQANEQNRKDWKQPGDRTCERWGKGE